MDTQGVIPSAPPAQLKTSVRKICFVVIVVAGVCSITLNIYHDTQIGNLPWTIAGMAGFVAPFSCATLAHIAAEVKFGWFFKILVFGVTAAMMYVSASAGVPVLEHIMKTGPAITTMIGLDTAAIICLSVLIRDSELKKAFEEWKQAEAERQAQAERDEIAARYGRTQRRETPRGNTGGNGSGNTWGNTGGNGLPGGGESPLPASEATAALPAGQGDGAGAEVLELDEHRSAARRESMSEDEMRALAEKMAGELAKIGEEISVRKFTDTYGGTPRRVGPIVREVKDRFAEAKKDRESATESAEAR